MLLTGGATENLMEIDSSYMDIQPVDTSIGYIMRGRSLRDLHTRGPQARGNVNHRRDRLPSDVTNLYHGKSIEHLTRFEDRNNVWPKLMVSYKFMFK